ncbi:MAG: hypothetical protein ACP5I4_09720 [Oceanipulchritudo sp.]
MGSQRKPLFQLALFFLAMPGMLFAQAESPPPNLPKPPPLPPEVLNRPPPTPPPDLPDPAELYGQLQQLEELLSMSPGKLSRLRQTIEFIEKMSPEEREAMRIRLSQITRATPELKQEIETLARFLPDRSRPDFSQFWLAASEEERERIRSRLPILSPDESRDLLMEHTRAFASKRDEVFARMRESLDEKRRQLRNTETPQP